MPNVRRLQRHPSEFQRQGELEYNLVETLAADVWWQRCLWAIDTGLVEVRMDRQEEAVEQEFTSLDERVRPAVAFSKLAGNGRAIALLGRYESRLRRDYERNLNRLEAMQAVRNPVPPAPAPAPPLRWSRLSPSLARLNRAVVSFAASPVVAGRSGAIWQAAPRNSCLAWNDCYALAPAWWGSWSCRTGEAERTARTSSCEACAHRAQEHFNAKAAARRLPPQLVDRPVEIAVRERHVLEAPSQRIVT